MTPLTLVQFASVVFRKANENYLWGDLSGYDRYDATRLAQRNCNSSTGTDMLLTGVQLVLLRQDGKLEVRETALPSMNLSPEELDNAFL